MCKKHKKNNQGFTLIELLIVVALLGALAALVLPSMQANRTKAMEATCDFNQVSTLKTLNDHYALNGTLPDALHTGKRASSADQASGTDLMKVPGDAAEAGTTLNNMSTVGKTVFKLMTEEEVNSCNAAGLTHVVYDDDGTTSVVLSDTAGYVGFPVPGATGYFADDGNPITFNGHDLTWWNSDAAGGAVGEVFMTFVTPIADWSTGGDNDWGKGLGASVSVKKAGECKVPVDADFAYYIAYIKAFSAQVDNETVPAILVGTSCPECGVTNP
ncbi:MAG: prepilin-type N-terminal cleavage/methylation domain-containing protein [Spartobacteria bacterium]|nr:prepilin-type N-terminal cleavage/methylation domain-containing protein [Spartobacteria bacterium]